MERIPSHKAHGFTLLEIVIALVIVAILATIGYAKYHDANEQNELTAMNNIASDYHALMNKYFAQLLAKGRLTCAQARYEAAYRATHDLTKPDIQVYPNTWGEHENLKLYVVIKANDPIKKVEKTFPFKMPSCGAAK